MFDHVCLTVNDMKWHMDLFLRVFGFHVDKYVGDPDDPEKVWFKESLQLNRGQGGHLYQGQTGPS